MPHINSRALHRPTKIDPGSLKLTKKIGEGQFGKVARCWYTQAAALTRIFQTSDERMILGVSSAAEWRGRRGEIS